MQLSLNEIQVESRKAARGAGLSWGMAEEVGYATSWLVERGIDALPPLLEVLRSRSDTDQVSDPLRIGTMIADHAHALGADEQLAFLQMRHPILVLPFLAIAARQCNRAITLQHEDGTWSLLPQREDPGLLIAASKRTRIVAITCKAEDLPLRLETQRVRSNRLDVDDAVWHRLQDLAHRTYVPATEASRQSGAGAGRIDND